MNLGAFLLGVLLLLLMVRAGWYWAIEDLAAQWYRDRETSFKETTGKPWYVIAYDRREARRVRRSFGRHW
jgi:hypothetical protein